MWNSLEFSEWLNYFEVIQDISIEASSIQCVFKGTLRTWKDKRMQCTHFRPFQREWDLCPTSEFLNQGCTPCRLMGTRKPDAVSIYGTMGFRETCTKELKHRPTESTGSINNLCVVIVVVFFLFWLTLPYCSMQSYFKQLLNYCMVIWGWSTITFASTHLETETQTWN